MTASVTETRAMVEIDIAENGSNRVIILNEK